MFRGSSIDLNPLSAQKADRGKAAAPTTAAHAVSIPAFPRLSSIPAAVSPFKAAEFSTAAVDRDMDYGGAEGNLVLEAPARPAQKQPQVAASAAAATSPNRPMRALPSANQLEQPLTQPIGLSLPADDRQQQHAQLSEGMLQLVAAANAKAASLQQQSQSVSINSCVQPGVLLQAAAMPLPMEQSWGAAPVQLPSPAKMQQGQVPSVAPSGPAFPPLPRGARALAGAMSPALRASPQISNEGSTNIPGADQQQAVVGAFGRAADGQQFSGSMVDDNQPAGGSNILNTPG